MDRADSLLAAGQYARARALLDGWHRDHPSTARIDQAERARALYLTAQLTEDAARAQELYVSIALGYPTAREAPNALLRLGQAWLANGEPKRSVTYLERVLNDYPSAPARPDAFLWLIRAHRASRNDDAACKVAQEGLKSGGLSNQLRELVDAEGRHACADPPSQPRVTPAPLPVLVTSPPPASPKEQPPRATAAADARFAVQTGAFRELRSANAIAAQLRRAGFDVRVAYVRSSSLARVRIGRFVSRSEAATTAKRAEAAGFKAIIVDDVLRERRER
ncbi:MAG TPA: SPOR domain-containing protein [Longimicrobiales bacterium]|nr:SPOR domain-containing protein [Longimicrobiales bacterium]